MRKSNVPEFIGRTEQLRDDITCVDNIMYKCWKVIFASCKREETLKLILYTRFQIWM